MTDVDDLPVVRAEHERPWFWPVISAFLMSFLTAALATALCLAVSDRNAQRGIQQRQQLQVQAREQHQAICAILIALDDNAQLDPPTTDLGRSNAKTYASLRVSQGCPPRTEK